MTRKEARRLLLIAWYAVMTHGSLRKYSKLSDEELIDKIVSGEFKFPKK